MVSTAMPTRPCLSNPDVEAFHLKAFPKKLVTQFFRPFILAVEVAVVEKLRVVPCGIVVEREIA